MNMSMKNGFFFLEKPHFIMSRIFYIRRRRPSYVSQATRKIGFFEAFHRVEKIPSHLTHWTPRDSGVFKRGTRVPQNEKHNI